MPFAPPSPVTSPGCHQDLRTALAGQPAIACFLVLVLDELVELGRRTARQMITWIHNPAGPPPITRPRFSFYRINRVILRIIALQARIASGVFTIIRPRHTARSHRGLPPQARPHRERPARRPGYERPWRITNHTLPELAAELCRALCITPDSPNWPTELFARLSSPLETFAEQARPEIIRLTPIRRALPAPAPGIILPPLRTPALFQPILAREYSG